MDTQDLSGIDPEIANTVNHLQVEKNTSGILMDKTMADKLMHIHNDNKQNYSCNIEYIFIFKTSWGFQGEIF